MFSSRLRLLSTGQSQQLSRYFSVKKPEPVKQPQGDSGSVNLKPRRNILPIATYDGQGATNGYFIALLDGSKKHAVLAQLEGCDYTITHDFPETLACFSGKFDTKALHILRTSPYVKGIAERYPVRGVWDEESS